MTSAIIPATSPIIPATFVFLTSEMLDFSITTFFPSESFP